MGPHVISLILIRAAHLSALSKRGLSACTPELPKVLLLEDRVTARLWPLRGPAHPALGSSAAAHLWRAPQPPPSKPRPQMRLLEKRAIDSSYTVRKFEREAPSTTRCGAARHPRPHLLCFSF